MEIHKNRLPATAGFTRGKRASGAMRVTAVSIACLSLLLYSCNRCSLPRSGDDLPESITILSYNVQNLFDDVYDGTEYDEYVPETGGWSSDRFHFKLRQLSEVLSLFPKGGADILLLQEVENGNALEMLRLHYLKSGGYDYCVISDASDQAVQTAILSRFPMREVQAHAVSLHGVTAGRPILECCLDVCGLELTLFNCHWKSKSGGVRSTEAMRIAAASLLNELIRGRIADKPDVPIIVAGDLNESIDEWELHSGSYPTALMPVSQVGGDFGPTEGPPLFVTGDFSEVETDGEAVVLFSPWLTEQQYEGSYVYQGVWERIDHFLLSAHFDDGKEIEYSTFRTGNIESFLDEEGFPLRWIPERETGYSDHLPILLYCDVEN